MKYIIQLLILFLFLFNFNAQAQYYSFKDVPKWVNQVETPKNLNTSKYDISAGYYLALTDYQANYEKDEAYHHEVLNVVSYSGITNASQMSISFDTSYQHLNIHSLYIWRKGKKIDYTEEITIELINNETNLNQGIYSGVITAYDILNDIRKGDLIDFKYTIVGSNPIFDSENYSLYPLEFSSRIDFLSLRIIMPKEDKYIYKCVKCDSVEYSDTVYDTYREINISAKDIKVTEYDDQMPSWTLPKSYFTISSFDSWQDVNTWAQDVFKLDAKPNLDDVFKEIFDGEENQEEKINKIIKYVQDDIRYMGIESGIGSIKPFSPEQVVKQRFGDCKDKSLLLVSLLKQVGVNEAYPVLVNSSIMHNLDEIYPTGHIFDHCITMYKYDSVDYWIDPTASLQGGGFKNMYCNNFERALIIGLPADSLHHMPESKVVSSTHAYEIMDVESFTKPTILTTISTRRGRNADNRRAVLEYYSIDELSKSIVDEMKKVYPKIKETEDVVISDNIDSNELTMTYKYEVDENWLDGSKLKAGLSNYRYIVFKPQVISQYLSANSCVERKYDISLEYPLNITYSVKFNFPKELLIYDTYEETENDMFFYSEKIEQVSSKSFQVDYEFRTKAKFIEAGSYKDICEEINEISKVLYLVIYFEK